MIFFLKLGSNKNNKMFCLMAANTAVFTGISWMWMRKTDLNLHLVQVAEEDL